MTVLPVLFAPAVTFSKPVKRSPVPTRFSSAIVALRPYTPHPCKCNKHGLRRVLPGLVLLTIGL